MTISSSAPSLVVALAVAAAISCSSTRQDAGPAERPGEFRGRFVAVSDVDMAATAYANGRLEPLTGAVDTATLFVDGASVATAPASNSVVSWPAIIAASPDGRHVYVAETRGPAPADADTVEDAYTAFPEGRRISILSTEGDRLEVVGIVEDAGLNIQSIAASRDGRFLVLGSEEEDAELVIIPLADGLPAGSPSRIALSPPYSDTDAESRIRGLYLSPDDRTIAANVANRRIQFYRLMPNAEGFPTDVKSLGDATSDFGVRLALGAWTPDGRRFLATDTRWPASPIGMLFTSASRLTVIEPPGEDGGAPRIVSEARVGRGAEGFSISPDGRHIASVNMERTYLPEIPLLSFWPGRRRYSVSLLSLDPVTGALEERGRVRAEGLLPEDAIFDRDGENVAVAVFHRRKGPDRTRGFVDFYRIESGHIVNQNVTQGTERGVHDLVLLTEE